VNLAYIPSPSQGVWHLGPIPIRAYALCIIAGIAAAIRLTQKRWVTRGGHKEDIVDIAIWAVPFGILGGRLYHLATDPELYFLHGRDPVRALYIWDGGLGIWGAVALGALGAWIGCRRRNIRLSAFADALAPGLILAQAIGRWGNYFNQELYGDPTKLPWGLLIDPAHRPAATPNIATYQPTFLYESLWDLAAVFILLWADRRWRMHSARLGGGTTR
jgi:prolipoprotein diacylglyceryl transferase